MNKAMFRKKAIKGLICFLAIGVFASTGWAMGKKPAMNKEQAVVDQPQADVKENPEVAEVESQAEAKVTEQKGTQTPETQAVELKPIMEYKLPEGEEIVDIIFGEAEMTVEEARALGMKGLEQKKATETVKVQYPKVLVTKNAVKFLDERGRMEREVLLKEENYEKPMVSLLTNRIVVKGKKGEGENCNVYAKWTDEKGKLIKIEEHILGEFGGVLMSENGKYIAIGLGVKVTEPEVGECKLYDINGNKLWTYDIEYPYHGGMDIFNDGSVVIVRSVEEGEGIKKGKIVLIDVNGEKLWENEIVDGTHKIFSTAEGKIIVYTREYHFAGTPFEKFTYILYGFNKNGNLLWKPKEYKGFNNSFHKLSVSKNANYLTGLTLWDHLWVMDINTGEFIWKYPLKGWKPDTLKISPDGKYVLLGNVLLLDGKSGKVLKRIKEGGKFLDKDKLWRRKGGKIEIFNISDILKED
ncbi:MAG: PQQ-binding-like beta-propeller repeat protein [bacterium]|nr:PQQ-binding-like beta-propeller repeat protein [bacterium]